MPASPPLIPTMILPSIASGAAVIEYPSLFSATFVFQRSAPDFASRAIRCASRVPK